MFWKRVEKSAGVSIRVPGVGGKEALNAGQARGLGLNSRPGPDSSVGSIEFIALAAAHKGSSKGTTLNGGIESGVAQEPTPLARREWWPRKPLALRRALVTLTVTMRPIPRYKLCFVCGRDNPASLDVQFFREGTRVVCDWIPHEKHLGYRDRVHGGVVATILDEAMSWSPTSEWRRMGFSIELNVKYRQPVPSGVPCKVEAEAVEIRSRTARTTGRILGPDGVVCAEATGVYFPLKPGATEQILEYLYLEGNERPVTLDDL